MMTCPHEKQAGMFCSNCGTRLRWLCGCGAWDHLAFPRDKFCPICGKARPDWVQA